MNITDDGIIESCMMALLAERLRWIIEPIWLPTYYRSLPCPTELIAPDITNAPQRAFITETLLKGRPHCFARHSLASSDSLPVAMIAI